jgi:ABC-type antimicrobial peptide transport system permease subunit
LLLFLAVVTVAVTSSVLLLSAAGIYAMMSFTVASRRREIGIRSALGAAPGRVLSGIFKRAGAQLGAGALGGLLLAEAVVRAAGESFLDDETALLLPTVAVLMMAIGLLAALGPARRGLAVQPTEALREE